MDFGRTSRTLSWLLRHHAVDHQLVVDSKGFVKWAEIQRVMPREFANVSLSDLMALVASDAKTRYQTEDRPDGLYIRANQGHSAKVGAIINDEDSLTRITTPCFAVHGTTRSAWIGIQKKGLLPMRRKHVHMASSTDADSGIRKDSQIHIIVNMKTAMDAGIEFYRSANGVILTPSVIPPIHLKGVSL